MSRIVLTLLCLAASLAAPAVAQDKIFRMPVTTVPPSLGNPFAANGPPSSFIWTALFDPLVRVSPDGQAQPALAVSWQPLSPTLWRFSLRDGVTFTNGEPLTAAGVKATFDYLMSADGRRMIVSNEMANIARVSVVDALTLDIETTKPEAILPKRVTSVLIVAPEAWASECIDGFAPKPPRTGPFTLDSCAGREG